MSSPMDLPDSPPEEVLAAHPEIGDAIMYFEIIVLKEPEAMGIARGAVLDGAASLDDVFAAMARDLDLNLALDPGLAATRRQFHTPEFRRYLAGRFGLL